MKRGFYELISDTSARSLSIPSTHHTPYHPS